MRYPLGSRLLLPNPDTLKRGNHKGADSQTICIRTRKIVQIGNKIGRFVNAKRPLEQRLPGAKQSRGGPGSFANNWFSRSSGHRTPRSRPTTDTRVHR